MRIKYAEYVKYDRQNDKIRRLGERIHETDYNYIINEGMAVDTDINFGRNSKLYSLNNDERFAIIMFEEENTNQASNTPNENTIYLVKENNRLKAALNFYSIEENYKDGVIGKSRVINGNNVWVPDNGDLARIVLEEI